jgi:hypothetical protein
MASPRPQLGNWRALWRLVARKVPEQLAYREIIIDNQMCGIGRIKMVAGPRCRELRIRILR